MFRRLLPILSVLLLTIGNVLAAEVGTVVAIVDGDTIKVELPTGVEAVRLIGVDTPETVHPQKPVEAFGKEASAFTTRLALGQMVRLEEDGQSANRDRYNRLLRYVWLADGRLLNAEIIAQGYGFAYVKYPFDRMEEFRDLERAAREANRGQWGAPDPAAAQRVAEAPVDGSETVYVTRTGTKYHRAGCRSLAKSSIPIALKDAAPRYGPCAICGPPTLAAPSGTPASPATVAPKASEQKDEQTVYATRTGTKYHRAGCRFLARSQIPLALKDAAARYSPCGVCGPPVPRASSGKATASPPPAAGGRCAAITKKGTRCSRNAAAGSAYCWQHGR